MCIKREQREVMKGTDGEVKEVVRRDAETETGCAAY